MTDGRTALRDTAFFNIDYIAHSIREPFFPSRKYNLEKQISSMSWKIPFSDIQINVKSYNDKNISGSSLSLTKVCASIFIDDGRNRLSCSGDGFTKIYRNSYLHDIYFHHEGCAGIKVHFYHLLCKGPQ